MYLVDWLVFNRLPARFLVFYTICTAIVIAATAYNSYNSGSIIVPKNERVVGTFVGYQPEGYNIVERSGKTTRYVDHHLVYVVYSVDDKLILLEGSAGAEYPKRAILYKN